MNEKDYWEKRYKDGATSGKGSIGKMRLWKWNVIKKYLNTIDDVLDVGCGDLSFWSNLDCKSYIGIDISPYIISKNQEERPNWKLICSTADIFHSNIESRIVLCFDVLFHIINEKSYLTTLKNLISYSKEWIFIHTWFRNPFSSWNYRYNWLRTGQIKMLISSLANKVITDNKYQRYRNFIKYAPIFENRGFHLIGIEKNESINLYGAIYVFHRQSNDLIYSVN